MNKKEVTLQQKANTIAGYKWFREKKGSLTKSTYNHILYEIYLLSIIGEYKYWSDLFLPRGTHIVCRYIPEEFEADCVISKDPTPYLELGKTYTIKENMVGESFSWLHLEELPEYRVSHRWFEIAKEDRLTPEEALKLYGDYIDEDYKRVVEYREFEERKRREEELKRPREIFIYKGHRFDFFSITDDYLEDSEEESALLDLCEECYKKYQLSEEYSNGVAMECDCSCEKCRGKAIYNYAIPLREGKVLMEKRQ